ncbi:MAG: TonB-dependent receptor [Sphingobacteriales bacterium]|nr:MAG: TonB-dependent receptor [Sphingobacteriales bacterium]
MKSILYTLLAVFFTPLLLSGQESITVSGTVTDAQTKEPLIGATITVQDTAIGTTTDIYGNYQLTVKKLSTLRYSFVGYEDQTAVAGGSIAIYIALKPSELGLNPVVVSASRRREKLLDAPASISLIEAKTVKTQVAVTTTDLVNNVPGVDVMKTGIQGANVVVRGFNSLFSNDLMVLVDNRIAGIPSLRANSLQMIPNANEDIERIEILRGPASAVYGPNSINGVMHLITKSPIDEQGTRIQAGIGLRSYMSDTLPVVSAENPKFDSKNFGDRMAWSYGLRHASVIKSKNESLKMGYKISGNYFNGNDWKYKDPNEPDSIIQGIQNPNGRIELLENGQQIPSDSVAAGVRGDYVDNTRNEEISRYNLDGRFDLRFKKTGEVVLAGGWNKVSDLSFTPLGALQNIGWQYWYAQTRLRYRNLFAQFYVNGSHSGDSYFLQTGDRSIEKSKLWAAQIQHSASLLSSLKLIYGIDAFWTRPNTEGSINGRFENKDNINEYGAYLQADYRITAKLNLTAALRSDYHSVMEKIFLSPRAALQYKPNAAHAFRATVNRAFKTPGAGALFIDILQSRLPTDITVRGIGNTDGFNYSFAPNPLYENQNLAQFRTSYGNQNQYYNVGDQSINNAAWNGALDIIFSGIQQQLSQDSLLAQFADLVNLAVGLILPDTLGNVGHVVNDLNLSTRTFSPSEWKNLKNIRPMHNAAVTTYELGYKGLLGKQLFFTIDAYRSVFNNYISPATLITPVLMFNADDLSNYLAPIVAYNLENSPSPALNAALVTILDDPDREFYGLRGNGNGRADDEVVAIMSYAASQLPIGAISPDNTDGATMVIATRNIGELTVSGIDFSAAIYLSKELKFSGSYSFVDKDSIRVPDAPYGFIALNAPRHKFRVAADYALPKSGLTFGVQFRWQDGFPANSGSYIGYVNARSDLDLHFAWTPTFYPKLDLTLSVQNVYNNNTPYFVGTPNIGRFSMFRIAHSL